MLLHSPIVFPLDNDNDDGCGDIMVHACYVDMYVCRYVGACHMCPRA